MGYRGVAGVVTLMVAAGACTTLWGIDELEFQPPQSGSGVGGGAGHAGGSVASGGMASSASVSAGTGGAGGAMPMPTPIDCLAAFQSGNTSDGVYTVDQDGDMGPMMPMQVYCNMTTAGGGWTLVWAYTFTNYANFGSNSNAVTPRPSWPLNVGDSVPVSTITPLSPTDYNAMDFTRWASFGSEFLVMSNINNSVRCTPDGGSLVDNVSGLVTCEVLTDVFPPCGNVVPNAFVSSNDGNCRPTLQVGNGYYFCWDGRTNNNWPTHDPCGSDQQNQLMNVANPGGDIYVRRQTT